MRVSVAGINCMCNYGDLELCTVQDLCDREIKTEGARRLPLPPQMKGYMRNAMDVMMK